MKIFFTIALLFYQTQTVFTADRGNDFLPVELYYFKAEIILDYILLTWGTATEVDNYGFNVERSSDLNGWTKLEFLPGYGTSNIPRDYAYEDTSVVPGSIYYYRLKQIDIVGSFAYSDTLTVSFLTDISEQNNFLEEKYYLFQNYPNPFNPTTTIGFGIAASPNPSKGGALVILKVFDVLGNEIKTLIYNEMEVGYHSVVFNASDLPSGVYFYKLISGKFTETKKFLLLK